MQKLIAVGLGLVLIVLLPLAALALGDDVSYGGGGGYDGGGYSDSSSYYFYDSGGGFGGGGSSSGGGTLMVLVIVFIVVMLIAGTVNKANQMPQAAVSPQSMAPLPVDEASLTELAQRDPQFSRSEIESMVKRWVLEFEQAWSDGDMTPCQDYIGENLFRTYQSQLTAMRENNKASRTEDLAVMNCQVSRWRLDGPNELLDVWIKQKKRTYKVALDDPSIVVDGYVDTVYELSYLWQLTRPAAEEGEPWLWVLNKVDKLGQVNL